MERKAPTNLKNQAKRKRHRNFATKFSASIFLSFLEPGSGHLLYAYQEYMSISLHSDEQDAVG